MPNAPHTTQEPTISIEKVRQKNTAALGRLDLLEPGVSSLYREDFEAAREALLRLEDMCAERAREEAARG